MKGRGETNCGRVFPFHAHLRVVPAVSAVCVAVAVGAVNATDIKGDEQLTVRSSRMFSLTKSAPYLFT